MKKIVLTFLAGFAGTALSFAQDAALVSVRIAKVKETRQFAFELFEGDAPETVANFKKLARKGFYKGQAVHRVFANNLVQMGDPLSRKKDRSAVGTGGPGYTLAPEIRRKHVRGAVAAARLPDRINPSRQSNGSQFYICLTPMPNLDGQYTVFGKVLWGYDTLELISNKAVDSNDNPVERIEIRSVKVVPIAELPTPPSAPKPGAAPAKAPRKAWWKIFG